MGQTVSNQRLPSVHVQNISATFPTTAHNNNHTHTHTHTHPFNGPLSGTTRVSRYQKGKTNLDLNEARDVGVLGCSGILPSCRPTNSVKALKATQQQLLLLIYPFNGLFARTKWVSRRYQIGRTSLDLNEARDVGVLVWQWHQLDHMQKICTSLQTDNHTDTPSLNFLQAGCSS